MRIIINSPAHGNIFSCFLCVYYWNDFMIPFIFKFNIYWSSQKTLLSVLMGDINTTYTQFTHVSGNGLSLASSINMKQALKVIGTLIGSTNSSLFLSESDLKYMGSTILSLGYSAACNIAHQHLTGSSSSLPLHQSAHWSNPRKDPFSKPRSTHCTWEVQCIIVLCGIVQTRNISNKL